MEVVESHMSIKELIWPRASRECGEEGASNLPVPQNPMEVFNNDILGLLPQICSTNISRMEPDMFLLFLSSPSEPDIQPILEITETNDFFFLNKEYETSSSREVEYSRTFMMTHLTHFIQRKVIWAKVQSITSL